MFRGKGAPWGNDGLQMAAVEVGAQNRAVVGLQIAHVGPIQMACAEIDGQAVRELASLGEDRLQVRPVGIDGHQSTACEVEEEQAAGSRGAALGYADGV